MRRCGRFSLQVPWFIPIGFEIARNQCSKCKARFYCGAPCQLKVRAAHLVQLISASFCSNGIALTQDWTAGHKHTCKRIVAARTTPSVASCSPFGMIIRADGSSIPVSHATIFFLDALYYNPFQPETVYRTLIGAFHVLIDATISRRPLSGCYMMPADTVIDAEPAQQQAYFSTWAEVARKSGMMPKWWNDSHQERLKVFAREDAEWGLIERIGSVEGAVTATERSRTRILSRQQVQQKLRTPGRNDPSLEMMLERVGTFEGGYPPTGESAPAYHGQVIQGLREGASMIMV